MPAPPPAAAQTNGPDPHQDQAAAGVQAPTRRGRFLNAVRRLIGYGKALVETLRQPVASPSLPTFARCFGSNDITAILARIARGLHRAAALEAWLITWVPRRQAAYARAPAPRQPHAAQPEAQRADDAGPAQPPTLEDIVARDRRRPIGAVIAEICCDLGIIPNHELWREVSAAVIQGGGNLVTLFRDAVRRLEVALSDPSGIAPPAPPPWPAMPWPPSPAASGAGPP
jgi:hypothetical protein